MHGPGLALLLVPLIDAVLLLGVAVVLPLALGGPLRWWAVAASAALVALYLPTGWSAVLVLPFAAVAAASALRTIRQVGATRRWRHSEVIGVIASLYALVAAGALAQSRSGVVLLGIREPIVALTSVHYMFAGSAALVLAAAALDGVGAGSIDLHRWWLVAWVAVVLTAGAPPIVAAGFVTGAALAQVGGAALMTVGVWLTASLELRTAFESTRPTASRVLLGISGLSIWVPMILAVAWAAGQHWDVPALSIPDMARTHGLANALAFVLCGLLGHRLGGPLRPTPSGVVA